MEKKKYEKPEMKFIEKDELKIRQKEYNTWSVLKFLKESDDLVRDYIEWVRERGKMPNYSDFLRMVTGTTAEKVNLASIYVIRSRATEYLMERYGQLYPEEVKGENEKQHQ